MIITNDWLIKNKTPNGGYNKKQFDILGIPYPPQKGWKEKLIGTQLSEDKVMMFEQISNPENPVNIHNIHSYFGSSTISPSTISPSIISPSTISPASSRSSSRSSSFDNPKLLDFDNIDNDNNRVCIDYFVYTDGSCVNNGTPEAAAGIGIYFGENDPRNVSKRVVGKQTNNTAELQAIIDTYDIITGDDKKQICIVSDSIYALRCLTSYGEKQENMGWSQNIPNKELVQYGYNLYKNKSNIYFMHIKAHTQQSDIHSIGNDGADQLANKAIGLEECPYNAVAKIDKIYLNVPFVEKEEVKKLGGRWDKDARKWYIMENNANKHAVLERFSKI